uniref:Uncharacterized protein n=1 Tax=Lygus hesperus TaxID=30085 RepID=A0A146LR73_LYGHE
MEDLHALPSKSAREVFDFGSLPEDLMTPTLLTPSASVSFVSADGMGMSATTATATANVITETKQDEYNDDITRSEEASSPTRSLLLAETRYRLIRFDEQLPKLLTTYDNNSVDTNERIKLDDNDNSDSGSVSSPLMVTSQLLHHSATRMAQRQRRR